MAKSGKATQAKAVPEAASYTHPESQLAMRPDVGTQAQFKKRKPPQTYRYDSSLSPALDWDGKNSAREEGERLVRAVLDAKSLEEAKAAASKLKAMSKPFLDWSGKAERLSFEVPTLPLFIHERLSTKAIIETLTGHKRDKQATLFDLFADPQHSVVDQVLKAYEHMDRWTNRMILGDSLVVMNSLLHYEGLGGQVQMIYMDPPYGVKFGSNFQPFVRKRDVSHGDDEDMTREPEMVQAYRDTWELGLHSYLTYMRDRLLLARELLHPSGSVFVQIGEDNVHHVREVMDEVFGEDNAVVLIAFRTTTGKGSAYLDSTFDFLLWYARDRSQLKFRPSFVPRGPDDDENLRWLELTGGERRRMTSEEVANPKMVPRGARIFRPNPLTSQTGSATTLYEYEYEGTTFRPSKGGWKTNLAGMEALERAGRLVAQGNTLGFIRYLDDFPYKPANNVWDDTRTSGFTDPKVYVVQTNVKVLQRCLLMTTDPGDLVLDPTCGSGTTAYVAEQWGRRWITVDVSRVPLALARQRLLTATYRWYELKDDARGPAGGFVYKREQNNRGEEVGGIVPHVTLKSIAQNEPPAEEVLVDRPEETSGITRVTGPFTLEGTISTALGLDLDRPGAGAGGTKVAEAEVEYRASESAAFTDRMLEILRKSPVLRLEGSKTVTLKNVRPPAKTLSLSAEALVVNGAERPVAFVFGPENGAVSEKLVFEAAREAHAKTYAHLYVIGFAIEPNARALVEKCADAVGVAATYVQATPDLLMGDLLKNMRSSQIFSVCGLPEVALRGAKPKGGGGKAEKGAPKRYEVELLGLDVFDPVTMEVMNRRGSDVPAWLLDIDYNGLSFHVSQAFFPRTAAWDNLKRALKGSHEESVWDHLAGTVSAPFEAGAHGQIAVKVIDDRGNELLVVKKLAEAKA